MSSTVPPIKMTRTINAPVDKVFDAWTDVAQVKRWFAPHPYEVREATVDVKPGGRYRLVVATDDDGPHTVTGEYLEVEPERRLVKTWLYEGPLGDDVTPSVVTVEFREVAPGVTEIKLTHAEIRSDEGGREGWSLIFDKLEAHVVAGA